MNSMDLVCRILFSKAEQPWYFLLYKQYYVTSFRFLVIFSFFSVSESGSSHDKEKRLERKYAVVHKCSYSCCLVLFQLFENNSDSADAPSANSYLGPFKDGPG